MSTKEEKEENAINNYQKGNCVSCVPDFKTPQVGIETARWREKKKQAAHVKAASGVNLGLPSSLLYEVSEEHR